MKNFLPIALVFCCQLVLSKELSFDASKNGAKLHGPFFRYDFLNIPQSVGPFTFKRKGIKPSFKKVDKKFFLKTKWPRALLKAGEITIYGANKKQIFSEKIDTTSGVAEVSKKESSKKDDNQAESKIPKNKTDIEYIVENFYWQKYLRTLRTGFYFCISKTKNNTFVKVCSDTFQLKDKKLVRMVRSRKVNVTLNGKKVPKNAQIHFSKETKTIHLIAKFKSGSTVEVKTTPKELKPTDISVDIKNKAISIKGQGSTPENADIGNRNQFASTFLEGNRIREQFDGTSDWNLALDDQQVEFFLYDVGADIQMFALVLPKPPPDAIIRIDNDTPIASYSSSLEIPLSYSKSLNLIADPPGEIVIDNGVSSWDFPLPNKAEVNHSNITLTKDNESYVFSHKLYRGQSFSATLTGALTANLKLETVLGGQAFVDFWPEKIIGNNKLSFQRWGFQASYYSALGEFPLPDSPAKPLKKGDGFQLSFYNFDILLRLNSGVRPVNSSLGLAFRYEAVTVDLKKRLDSEFSSLGFGAFWHAAPPGWIDTFLDLWGLFDYPKWLELSAFYYPISQGEFLDAVTAKWSMHARGRLLISDSFFFDASLNISFLEFEAYNNYQGNQGEFYGISSNNIYGTVGFGVFF